jgi:uncharacterized protein YkwD
MMRARFGARSAKRLRMAMFLALACGLFHPSPRGLAQGNPRVEEMHRIINIERNTLERPMLVWSDVLSAVAQRRADDLARDGGGGDSASAGQPLKKRILATGVPFAMVAECIAYTKAQARDAFDEWMRDRKNWTKMFRKEYTDVGIGYAYNPKARHRHYWVVVLGTPKKAKGE